MFFHLICNTEYDVLEHNKKLAEKNEGLLEKNNVIGIDFLGAIGSGKTALISMLFEKLKQKKINVAAITGDLSGSDDADRLKAIGMAAETANTGKECHLDAHLISHILEHMNLSNVDVLFIENVGNLICPVDFPLGSKKRVVVISVTEGDDMIRKHPLIFGLSDITIINKIDLAQAMDIDLNVLKDDYKKIKPNGKIIMTSIKTNQGIDELIYELGF